VRQGGIPFVTDELERNLATATFAAPKGSPLLAGLIRAGVPRDFSADDFAALRLKPGEIESLVFGHRLHGRNLANGVEHGVAVSPDGIALSFGVWGGGAATAKLEGDRLCFERTTTTTCGTILRNPGGKKELENEYIWFVGGWTVPFSQAE
jgi:hypothetical protein